MGCFWRSEATPSLPRGALMRYLFPLNPYNQQRQFEKPVWVYPAHLAMYATALRDAGHDVVWDAYAPPVPFNYPRGYLSLNDKVVKDDYSIDIPFLSLPYPDRTFTDAKNPRWQSYGNYRWHPATHMMASNLCWWGKCTFCVDTKKLEEGELQQTRPVAHVIEEIDNLIFHGYREVFDDSGTFPVGKWLEEFCGEMRKRGRNTKIKVGCNMKPVRLDFKMMYEAGFRFILVGVESANQRTLDIIKKGQHQLNVERNLKAMADAGLLPHLTSMFGYPWESHDEEMNTVRFIQHMLKKGYAKTAQASVYSPPRTAPDPASKGHRYIPMIYEAYRSPEFWYHKVKDLRCWEDFTYLLRGGRLVAEEYWRKFWHGRTARR